MTPKPYYRPTGRWWLSGCPWLAQYETSGWWDAQPWLTRLHLVDFMLHTGASSQRDFWAMRQKKTLALAQVLQACTEESGIPTGILCELARELQKYMPPMTFSGVYIVEASLLKPTGEEHGTSLNQRRKTPS